MGQRVESIINSLTHIFFTNGSKKTVFFELIADEGIHQFLGPYAFLQVPVLMNAVGGILVGLVTTYAGGVRKASA
jgi:hypothetical protein